MSPPPEVRALLDALPMPAMLLAEGGEVLHANAAASAQPPAGEGATLVLPQLGVCRLLVAPPPNPQTQRLASLGFMLASVCHEISNPLAAVSSMLQILQSKRGVTPATMEKGLASIAANIARVHAITRKLGAYSRVGSEGPAPRAIDDAVEAAAALLRHSPCGESVRLDFSGAPGVTVLARPGELEQVLFNIFLNAAQAMHGAGRIEANAKKENGRITVSIRDTGPGIAPEHLARVFDPFFTTKQASEGTGLGLAISYEIVHELGGALHAANDPQGGARFEILLPA